MRTYVNNGKIIIDNCLPTNELSLQTVKLLINSLKIMVDKLENSISDAEYTYQVIQLPDLTNPVIGTDPRD